MRIWLVIMGLMTGRQAAAVLSTASQASVSILENGTGKRSKSRGRGWRGRRGGKGEGRRDGGGGNQKGREGRGGHGGDERVGKDRGGERNIQLRGCF